MRTLTAASLSMLLSVMEWIVNTVSTPAFASISFRRRLSCRRLTATAEPKVAIATRSCTPRTSLRSFRLSEVRAWVFMSRRPEGASRRNELNSSNVRSNGNLSVARRSQSASLGTRHLHRAPTRTAAAAANVSLTPSSGDSLPTRAYMWFSNCSIRQLLDQV